MDRLRRIFVPLLIAAIAAPSGCSWRDRKKSAACTDQCYDEMATQIEYPAESPCTECSGDASLGSPPPVTISSEEEIDYWDVSLAEAIQLALAHSEVLRELGAAVVEAPSTVRTQWDAAIVETDPRFGVEGALSEFDAQFINSVFWEKNDRQLNNQFFGGGTRNLQQDVGVFQSAITKRTAVGSQVTIRHNVDYDANNAPGNLLPSVWNTNIEMEIRQPVLQGAGTEFNRIAGPFGEPGVYNGVLIARLNTDVALTDFEIGVRDLISNLENAYWDLYYGYRDLDAKIKARDRALETWRRVEALSMADRADGEAQYESQAREQYFRLQEEVQNALSGQLFDGTRTGNGSVGGTFRGSGGVLVAERRLRLLIGLPPTDGRLMRPSDEPVMAKCEFDWEQSVHEAATRRAELRRQKWEIRRRELELIASKNFLLPRLDGVARQRWRGIGDELIDPNNRGSVMFADPNITFPQNAYADLTSGRYQEWQLGFELSIPIGYRKAHAGVRNAELLLARSRAVLREQQRDVVHELSDAVAEMDRAYTISQTSYNRLTAARDQLEALEAAYENRTAELNVLLDSQRRMAESESNYYRTLAQYAIATKNVHFVKGTLLSYDGVYLSEGPWPGKAYSDAVEREANRSTPRPLNYASSRAPVVGWGDYPQIIGGPVVETDGPYPREYEGPVEEESSLQQPEFGEPRPFDTSTLYPQTPTSDGEAKSAEPIATSHDRRGSTARVGSAFSNSSSGITPASHSEQEGAAADSGVAPATTELPVQMPTLPRMDSAAE